MITNNWRVFARPARNSQLSRWGTKEIARHCGWAWGMLPARWRGCGSTIPSKILAPSDV